jgi:hypothetical protein
MAQRRDYDPRPGTRGDGATATEPATHGQPGPNRPPGPPPWWGSRPGRLGVFTVIAGAVLGAIGTIVIGREPGPLLGILVIAATLVAVFAVRPRASYLVIPVPALAYIPAAVAAGLVHDRAMDTSHTALLVNAVQWVASGFFAMTTATALAIVVAAGRMLAERSLNRPARERPDYRAPGLRGSGGGAAGRGRGTRGLPAAGRPGPDRGGSSQRGSAGDPPSSR